MEVSFKCEQIAKRYSTLTIKARERTQIPIYLEQNVTKISIRNISSEIDNQ